MGAMPLLSLILILSTCWIVTGIESNPAVHSRKEVTIRLLEHDPATTITNEGFSDAWTYNMRTSNGMEFVCSAGSGEPISKQSLESGCLESESEQGNYWQYEVCLGANASQIHRENGKVATRISLGKFVSSNATSQHYASGAGGRSTTVLFTCDSAAAQPQITRWEEPKPLHYVLHVGTKVVCAKNQPSLDGLACIDRYVEAYRIIICPGTSVTQTKEMEIPNDHIMTSYKNFISRTSTRQRIVEMYESADLCPTVPVAKKQARIVYNCLRGHRHPVVQTLDTNGCLTTIRIGIGHVCDIQTTPVDCRQIVKSNPTNTPFP